jgi:predicted Rossmann fold nucleotide-binding protein DprA/Smf involved in DNA uptake
MPQIRKLSPAEVETLDYKPKGQRKLIEEQYDAILSEYATGEYGEALLEPQENRLTVRNRLLAAAGRRGLGINFRRTSGELLRFQIVANGAGAAVAAVAAPVPEPVIEPEPAPKKRGGRPKKTA